MSLPAINSIPLKFEPPFYLPDVLTATGLSALGVTADLFDDDKVAELATEALRVSVARTLVDEFEDS